MAGFILFSSSRLKGQWSWSAVVLHSLMGAGIYAVLFLVAMDRQERDWYCSKVKEVFRRSPINSTPTDLSMP
jgi:hypothetical protein